MTHPSFDVSHVASERARAALCAALAALGAAALLTLRVPAPPVTQLDRIGPFVADVGALSTALGIFRFAALLGAVYVLVVTLLAIGASFGSPMGPLSRLVRLIAVPSMRRILSGLIGASLSVAPLATFAALPAGAATKSVNTRIDPTRSMPLLRGAPTLPMSDRSDGADSMMLLPDRSSSPHQRAQDDVASFTAEGPGGDDTARIYSIDLGDPQADELLDAAINDDMATFIDTSDPTSPPRSTAPSSSGAPETTQRPNAVPKRPTTSTSRPFSSPPRPSAPKSGNAKTKTKQKAPAGSKKAPKAPTGRAPKPKSAPPATPVTPPTPKPSPNQSVQDPSGDLSDQPAEAWTVAAGDHLWHVARSTLADTWHRPPTDAEILDYLTRLIAENRSTLVDPANPDLIHPGQRFTLPAITG